jgi:hypothetical protein
MSATEEATKGLAARSDDIIFMLAGMGKTSTDVMQWLSTDDATQDQDPSTKNVRPRQVQDLLFTRLAIKDEQLAEAEHRVVEAEEKLQDALRRLADRDVAASSPAPVPHDEPSSAKLRELTDFCRRQFP